MKTREHDFQIAAFDRHGNVIHCGVHGVGRLTHRTIVKLHRKWVAWRIVSIINDMDIKRLACIPRVKTVTAFPIGQPKKVKMFNI